MSQIHQALAKVLKKAEQPSSFYATGKTESQLFSLSVTGIGAIALPLLPQQANALIQLAEPAPFGRGEATILDTSVRNTKQIAADQISIKGKGWQSFLDSTVAAACQQLGVKTKVSAELYKLLVYETGGFFVNHRDTEKEDGMFATLIISLPSEHTGGELRVEHAGQIVSLTLNHDDPSELSYAAFYADCVHEVLPVTSGYRLVLVYNLCHKDKGKRPQAPVASATQEKIVGLLQDWTKEIAISLKNPEQQPRPPHRLVYLLEHAYTSKGLSFEHLKSKDKTAADVLISAAREANYELFLALLTIEESGAANFIGGYYPSSRKGRRYHSYDEDDDEENAYDPNDFEIEEVIDHTRHLQDWIHVKTGKVKALETSFSDDELSPPECLALLEPDEQYFEEATGNAGASFERTYRRAVLVLWPKAHAIQILTSINRQAVLLHIQPLFNDWFHQGAEVQSQAWQVLQTKIEQVLANWNSIKPEADRGRAATLGELLEMALLMHAPNLVSQALDVLAEDPTNNYVSDLNEALVLALALSTPEKAEATLSSLIAELLISVTSETLFGYIRLAKKLIEEQIFPRDWLQQVFRPLLSIAISELKMEKNQRRSTANDAPFSTDWRDLYRGFKASRKLLKQLLYVFSHLDPKLGKQLVDTLFANLSRFAVYELLMETIIPLRQEDAYQNEVTAYFVSRCLAYLDARIAQPLSPPSDWTRDVGFDCQGRIKEDCLAFAQFLRNPEQQEWSFKAVQQRRDELEQLAKKYDADVTMTTIRKGSPHILHFSKNQNSYEGRVADRERDETYRKKLSKQ